MGRRRGNSLHRPGVVRRRTLSRKKTSEEGYEAIALPQGTNIEIILKLLPLNSCSSSSHVPSGRNSSPRTTSLSIGRTTKAIGWMLMSHLHQYIIRTSQLLQAMESRKGLRRLARRRNGLRLQPVLLRADQRRQTLTSSGLRLQLVLLRAEQRHLTWNRAWHLVPRM